MLSNFFISLCWVDEISIFEQVLRFLKMPMQAFSKRFHKLFLALHFSTMITKMINFVEKTIERIEIEIFSQDIQNGLIGSLTLKKNLESPPHRVFNKIKKLFDIDIFQFDIFLVVNIQHLLDAKNKPPRAFSVGNWIQVEVGDEADGFGRQIGHYFIVVDHLVEKFAEEFLMVVEMDRDNLDFRIGIRIVKIEVTQSWEKEQTVTLIEPFLQNVGIGWLQSCDFCATVDHQIFLYIDSFISLVKFQCNFTYLSLIPLSDVDLARFLKYKIATILAASIVSVILLFPNCLYLFYYLFNEIGQIPLLVFPYSNWEDQFLLLPHLFLATVEVLIDKVENRLRKLLDLIHQDSRAQLITPSRDVADVVKI